MQKRTCSLSASSGPGLASAITSDQSFTKHFHSRQASWKGRLQARLVCSSCMGTPPSQQTETRRCAQRGEQEQGSWLPSGPLMHHHAALQAFKLTTTPGCSVSWLEARCALQLRCSTAGPGLSPLEGVCRGPGIRLPIYLQQSACCQPTQSKRYGLHHCVGTNEAHLILGQYGCPCLVGVHDPVMTRHLTCRFPPSGSTSLCGTRVPSMPASLALTLTQGPRSSCRKQARRGPDQGQALLSYGEADPPRGRHSSPSRKTTSATQAWARAWPTMGHMEPLMSCQQPLSAEGQPPMAGDARC